MIIDKVMPRGGTSRDKLSTSHVVEIGGLKASGKPVSRRVRALYGLVNGSRCRSSSPFEVECKVGVGFLSR